MPAFNGAGTVSSAIGSVLDQSDDDLEVIVVDDGSTDQTFKIADRITDPRVRAFRLDQNAGAAAARNHALQQARGRYIAFLDADDLWLPGKLEKQLSVMQQQNVALSYTGFFRDNGASRKAIQIPSEVTHAQLLRGNVIGCLTAIYDSETLGKTPMPDLRLRQDFALWLALLRRVDKAVGIAEPLAVHFRKPGSLSSSLFGNAVGTWRMYREAEALGRLQTARLMTSHYLNRYRAIR